MNPTLARLSTGQTIPVTLVKLFPGRMWLCADANLKQYTIHESQITMQTVPHRFKKEQFDRYAPFIAKALENWPNLTKVVPQAVSMETFSARFRDAVTAAIKFGYEHPSVSQDDLKKNGPDLSVAMRADCVIIGPRHAIRADSNLGSVLPNSNKKNDEIEVKNDPDCLAHVCMLLHNRAFVNTPTLFVRAVEPDIINKLEEKWDVCFAEDPNEKGKFLIV